MFAIKNPFRSAPKRNEKKQGEYQFEVRHFTVREIARRVWPLAEPLLLRLLFASGLVLLVGFAVALGPMLPKYIIDEAIPQRDMGLALLIAGIFLASQFLRMGLWFIAQRIILWSKEFLLYQLRCEGFGHLQRLCLKFHNQHPSGFLYDRVFGNSINTVGAFLQIVFTQMVVHLTGLVFALSVCLYWSPPLTGVIVLGAVGYVVVARVMSPRIYAKSLAFVQEANRIAQYIVDKLRGTRTIQSMAIEGRVQDDFEARIWPMQLKALDAQMMNMKLHFVTEGLGYTITAAVMVLGTHAVFHWDLKVGVLVAFAGYQGQLIGFVGSLLNVYGQFMSARAGFDQLFTILETQPTVEDKPAAPMPRPLRGELELRNVSFAYDDKPVIRNLTATFPPGQRIALVGRSGGGKTTLTSLLVRFYDPTEGELLLDGHDVRDLPLRGYRALFGVVLQDPFLFDDTIEGNLHAAAPLATEEELWDCLEKAQAADFVRAFPDGLKHRCGEGGGQLSGGQRQRLAIARCMLLHPRFLILDEATSALDNETESYIQKALDALFQNRTAFIIAHRLSTIRKADRILVIDDGRVVEDGTYEQLMAREGLFHHLQSLSGGASDASETVGTVG